MSKRPVIVHALPPNRVKRQSQLSNGSRDIVNQGAKPIDDEEAQRRLRIRQALRGNRPADDRKPLP